MMVLDVAAVVLLAGMLAVALLNLATAPRLRDAGEPRGRPPVSVLVPARDEAGNLARTLLPLVSQDWPRLEVVVLDDQSADGTADVDLDLAALQLPARIKASAAMHVSATLGVSRSFAPPPIWYDSSPCPHAPLSS